MGEDELPFEALAGLPDEMLCEAFADWVSANKPGQIAQVKVGMVVSAVRLKYGAELIDPLPKKKAIVPTIPSVPGDAGMGNGPAPPPQQQHQQQPEQHQQLQHNPFVPSAVPRAVVDVEAERGGGENFQPGSLPDIPMDVVGHGDGGITPPPHCLHQQRCARRHSPFRCS